MAQDGFHLGRHADVEHQVGFVQHHNANGLGADAAALDQVQRPARRGYYDLRTGVQGLALRAVADAAQNADDPRAAAGGQRLGDGRDLLHQFARGSQNQGLLLRAIGVDAFQQRQHVGQRLAGAGAGLAHDVTAVQQERDAGGLDWCGIGYGLVCEVVGEVLANSEINETSDGECSLDQARRLNMAIDARFPMFARTGSFAARSG